VANAALVTGMKPEEEAGKKIDALPIEAGVQYVTNVGEAKLFRKLKTSYLGT
jgi:hypothetical protein